MDAHGIDRRRAVFLHRPEPGRIARDLVSQFQAHLIDGGNRLPQALPDLDGHVILGEHDIRREWRLRRVLGRQRRHMVAQQADQAIPLTGTVGHRAFLTCRLRQCGRCGQKGSRCGKRRQHGPMKTHPQFP